MHEAVSADTAAAALAAALDAERDAEMRRLVWVGDSLPGWTRVRKGEDFEYLDEQGQPIRDEEQLGRIRRLAIPPAYERVWICPLPYGHVQATARDARGRKQYRYHELWQELSNAHKFLRMNDFGQALPKIRRAVEKGLQLRGLPREKVLATIVRLLDETRVRVGNDEYARENGSYGLTTLRNRHAAVKGSTLRLRFKGKSGVHHQIELEDPQIARVVRKLQELPGQELFQWVDDSGETHSIGSADVNDYLREISGGDFTAKDFRTWHASAMVLERLHPCEAGTAKEARAMVKQVIAEVAQALGHTQSVCRKSYVHPDVLKHFTEGRLRALCDAGSRNARAIRGLKPAERQLLALLGGALSGEAPKPRRTRGRKDHRPTMA